MFVLYCFFFCFVFVKHLGLRETNRFFFVATIWLFDIFSTFTMQHIWYFFVLFSFRTVVQTLTNRIFACYLVKSIYEWIKIESFSMIELKMRNRVHPITKSQQRQRTPFSELHCEWMIVICIFVVHVNFQHIWLSILVDLTECNAVYSVGYFKVNRNRLVNLKTWSRAIKWKQCVCVRERDDVLREKKLWRCKQIKKMHHFRFNLYRSILIESEWC